MHTIKKLNIFNKSISNQENILETFILTVFKCYSIPPVNAVLV